MDNIALGVREKGFALVRGALDPHTVSRYLSALDAIYAERDDGDISPDDFRAHSGLEITDLFNTPDLKEAARAVLGCNEMLNGTFMTVAPGQRNAISGIALHTDGIIQGTNSLSLTLWAPLHQCGVDAPGITVIAASKEHVLEYLRAKFPGKKIPGWHSTTEWETTGAFLVEEITAAFGPVCNPQMDPGDVMVFTNWTIHGSNVTPDMSKRRSAAILRVTGSNQWRNFRATIRGRSLALLRRLLAR